MFIPIGVINNQVVGIQSKRILKIQRFNWDRGCGEQADRIVAEFPG